ncbi:MAG TPA: hypothetical protein PLL72_07615 [Burkholderiaceae bacterium]|nr:hypothetical protein [Burkholderiaceae bacterium]
MSDANSYAQAYTDAFSKFVPGFDFLQGLVKNAGQTLPSMGQWIAPVLDPAELDRRIAELRTVQFWLEQNARMISATIQAMEVQRMTLSALQGMNVSMGDLSEALKIRVPDVFGAAASAAAASAAPAAAPAPAPAPAPAAAEAPAGAPAVDPMQWWGALTQQFTQLASQAMQATSEAASQATQAMQAAGAAATDAAAEAMAQATPMAAAAVDSVKAAAEAVVQAVPMPSVAKAAATAPAAPAPKAAPRKSATKAAAKSPSAPVKKAARKSTT